MGNSSSAPDSPKTILEKGCGWIPDSERAACFHCEAPFSFFANRRHHCRLCGEVFCDDSQCWGSKTMLPAMLFVEADPISGSAGSSTGGSGAAAGLPFLTTPQSVCRVCQNVLNGPLRKVALTLPETAISKTASANRALWADPQYRAKAAEHVIHINVLSVGQKESEPRTMFPVNRRYRLHLDAWRPFNKQTRLFFCAVDPIGPDDEAQTPENPTPRSRSGSTNAGSPGVSAMRRTRRKSRTDLVIEMPPNSPSNERSDEDQQRVTLPNRWSLGGTAVFNCEPVEDPAEGVRLETFSDIIVIATDTTVASHFTLSTSELYQVIKQTIDHSRVRGKVRVSSVKAPSTKLLKRSKS